jgi:nucleoside-diphosphate kinase
MNRTLVICKPDAFERGLVGQILSRIEARTLRIVAAELRTIEKAVAGEHYGEHRGKPFYEDLVTFITRGPVLLLVVEGPSDVWAVVRTMIGVTDPAQAAPGTIRGDLAISTTENLVHGSDSQESAAREIALFFPNLAASLSTGLVTGEPGA